MPVPASPPPHGVPVPALPFTAHCGVPLEQMIPPVVHGLPVLHDDPALHGTQAPEPLHTPPVQGVPGALLDACEHTGPPELPAMVAFSHSLLVVQSIPLEHATHAPAPLHTPSGQVVPAVMFCGFVHLGVPVEQEITPL